MPEINVQIFIMKNFNGRCKDDLKPYLEWTPKFERKVDKKLAKSDKFRPLPKQSDANKRTKGILEANIS